MTKASKQSVRVLGVRGSLWELTSRSHSNETHPLLPWKRTRWPVQQSAWIQMGTLLSEQPRIREEARWSQSQMRKANGMSTRLAHQPFASYLSFSSMGNDAWDFRVIISKYYPPLLLPRCCLQDQSWGSILDLKGWDPDASRCSGGGYFRSSLGSGSSNWESTRISTHLLVFCQTVYWYLFIPCLFDRTAYIHSCSHTQLIRQTISDSWFNLALHLKGLGPRAPWLSLMVS